MSNSIIAPGGVGGSVVPNQYLLHYRDSRWMDIDRFPSRDLVFRIIEPKMIAGRWGHAGDGTGSTWTEDCQLENSFQWVDQNINSALDALKGANGVEQGIANAVADPEVVDIMVKHGDKASTADGNKVEVGGAKHVRSILVPYASSAKGVTLHS